MTGHQPVGEETAAMGVVLARAGAPGRLLGAVRDGAVTVHDQLSETAPHPSPPHRRGRHPPAENPSDPGPAGEVFRVSPEEPWRVLRTRLRVEGAVPGPIETGKPGGHFTGATGVTGYPDADNEAEPASE